MEAGHALTVCTGGLEEQKFQTTQTLNLLAFAPPKAR